MQNYLQHSEKDSNTEHHIEVVFDIKKNSHKIALLDFLMPEKKLLKQKVIKQINLNGEYSNHYELKMKLNKKRIEEYKKYI